MSNNGYKLCFVSCEKIKLLTTIWADDCFIEEVKREFFKTSRKTVDFKLVNGGIYFYTKYHFQRFFKVLNKMKEERG